MFLFGFGSYYLAGLFGRYLGYRGSVIVSTIHLVFTFLLTVCVLCCLNNVEYIVYNQLVNEIRITCMHIWVVMFAISITLVVIIIAFVSIIIQIHLTDYMSHDSRFSRFIHYRNKIIFLFFSILSLFLLKLILLLLIVILILVHMV
jgi:NADH:ubiquinone oxidoreductase subunit 5 (subunit L)/multisubunit Na+/H+ antiporter MnhA subunit